MDMFVEDSYIYNASASSMRQFQIICSIAPVEYYHLIPMMAGWNLMSLPSDESVDKENITVIKAEIAILHTGMPGCEAHNNWMKRQPIDRLLLNKV